MTTHATFKLGFPIGRTSPRYTIAVRAPAEESSSVLRDKVERFLQDQDRGGALGTLNTWSRRSIAETVAAHFGCECKVVDDIGTGYIADGRQP